MNIKLLSIDFQNVTKRYGRIIILNNLNMHLDNQMINVLVGPNGMGKSTLIKCLIGALKYTGTIDTNIKRIAYCPEKYLLPDYMVVSNFFTLLPFNQQEVKRMLTEYQVNETKKMCELSKGMQQKIMLSFTILRNADAYVFDEPLNGLDDQSVDLFLKYLAIRLKQGKFIMLSTHNPQRFKTLPINTYQLGDYNCRGQIS